MQTIDQYLIYEAKVGRIKSRMSSRIGELDLDIQKLADKGSSIINGIRERIRSELSDDAVKYLEKEGKRIAQGITSGSQKKIKKVSEGIQERIQKTIKYIEDKFSEEQLSHALVLFCLLSLIFGIVSFLVSALGITLMGSETALMALVVAPFVEELFKKLAIEKNAGYIFTAIFSVYEMIKYVLLTPAGILARIPALLLHFYTTTLMKYMPEANKEKVSKLGYVLAIVAHALFNAAAGSVLLL